MDHTSRRYSDYSRPVALGIKLAKLPAGIIPL